MSKANNQVNKTFNLWKTELTSALLLEGFGVEYQTSSHLLRIGRLIVTKPGTDVRYTLEFKQRVVNINSERCVVAEVHVPVGRHRIRIHKFSQHTVAKIVNHAKTAIEVQHARDITDKAQRRRAIKAGDIRRQGMEGFDMPQWAGLSLCLDSDDDIGLFTLSLHSYVDWPLTRITLAQAKRVIETVRSRGSPPFEWHPGSEPVPPELIVDPATNPETKMLLLCVDSQPTPVRGWYYGGLLNEFRMEFCNNAVQPTHWAPLPKKPK